MLEGKITEPVHERLYKKPEPKVELEIDDT